MEILLQIFRNQKTGKPPLRKLIRQQVTRVWRKWGRTNQQWAAKQNPSSVVGGRNSNRLLFLTSSFAAALVSGCGRTLNNPPSTAKPSRCAK